MALRVAAGEATVSMQTTMQKTVPPSGGRARPNPAATVAWQASMITSLKPHDRGAPTDLSVEKKPNMQEVQGGTSNLVTSSPGLEQSQTKRENLPPSRLEHRATLSRNPKRTRGKAGALASAFGRHKDPDFDRSLPLRQSLIEDSGMRTSKRLFNPDRDDAKTFNPQVTPAVDPGPRLFDVTPHRRKESRKHPRLSEQRFISIVQRNDAAGEPRAKDRHFPRPSVAVLAPHESEERLRMVRQPETRPISPEQLIAEVKGIYAGLIMVEQKCCEVGAKQHQAALEMDGRQQTLNNEQWQAKKSAAATARTKPGQDKIDTPVFNLFGLSGTGGSVPGMLGLAGKLLGKTHHQSSGLQGRLNGHSALALADSASWANVMTEAYASKNNFLIDSSPQNVKDVPMATGSLRIIGKVTVEWTFEDEPDQAYIIDFDVALKSVYDIILGYPFLQKTKSLNEYKHKLVPMPQCRPRGNILCINNIGDLYQKLPMMARAPGRSRKFRMQGLPDTGAEGEVMSEAYARKNNLKLLRSDTKFLLPDGTLVDSIGRVCLFLSFDDKPGNPIPTYFEVMRDCRHEVILGHNFVFEHRIFSDNVHRLVNIIGQIGLNLIIFFRKRKNADAARVQEEIRRHDVVHAIAMDNRVQRRAGQSSGLLYVPSTTAPALLGQNLAQGPPNLMDNPNIRSRARLPSWRQVFCLR